MKRDTILNKFMYGDPLSLEEIKFIADTSKLLNNCIDRRFY